MNIPADVRHNNPLNIRPGQPWEGLATPSEDGGFCVFTTPAFGFRAAFRNYIVKADRGINTIRKLITEWAPPADHNDTEAYIANVCKLSGYGAEDLLNLKSWDVASTICYAQVIEESGEPFEKNWKRADMAEGAYRAGIVDAPAPVAHKILTSVTGSGAAVAAAATAAEPAVTSAMNHAHSSTAQVGLALAAMVLAAAAVFFGTRSKGS